MKERESRAKNLVIVGISEERNEVTQDITIQFLKEKLDLNCETSITDVKRLGKKFPNRSRPRPILISLNTSSCEKKHFSKALQLGWHQYIHQS